MVEAAGGLTFDSDIDQVFAAQKATVVNGSVVTPSATVVETAPKPMTDEEAFVKGVKTGTVSQQDYAKAAKDELNKKKTVQPVKKPTDKPREKDFSKYFAIQAGAMPLDLNISGTLSLGDIGSIIFEEQNLDVGGTSAIISSKFLWRIKETNLWVGPTLSAANISNSSYAYQYQVGSEPVKISATSSGNILSFGVGTNYYLNPINRIMFYLTASASYEMLTFNYRGSINTASDEIPFRNSIKSNGFAGGVGLGVETWVDDIMLGLEARQVFAQRSGELKNSASSNTVIQAQFSWKF